MLERSRLHLFCQQLLIDQSIQNSPAIFVREQADSPAAEQGFITERIIPIALQDDVPIHGSDDAIDDFTRPSRRKRTRAQEKGESDGGDHLLHEGSILQNGWPMLKNTLKWRKRCVSKTVLDIPVFGSLIVTV